MGDANATVPAETGAKSKGKKSFATRQERTDFFSKKNAARGEDAPPAEKGGKPSNGGKQPFRPPHPPRVGGSYAAAVSDGTPRFAPGAHPVIFSAGVGQPLAQVHFGLKPAEVLATCERHLTDVERDPRVVEYLYRLPDDNTRTKFRQAYKASGVLCAAQNLVLSHVNAKFPMGDFSALNGAKIPHLRTLRSALSQYGDFSHAETGMRVTPAGYEGEVRRLVRLAHDLIMPAGTNRQKAERSWLPTTARDEAFFWTLASQLVAVMRGLCSAAPTISEVFGVLFTNPEHPPCWYELLSSLLPVEEKDDWKWVFDDFPEAQAFVALFTGVQGTRRLVRLGLRWANPSDAHLHWRDRANAQVSPVLDAWSQFATMVADTFHLSEKADFASSAVGSPMQLALITAPSPGVTVVRMVLAALPSTMSLATSFPCSVVWDQVAHEPLAVTTTSVLIEETRRAWVQTDLK